ncbi:hypothetical protein ACOMHN_046176 [Nucella lapillus]
MAEGGDYSIQTGEIKTFGIVDYVMFSLVLVISSLIGVFYAIKDRHKVTTDTFLLAGHSMATFPVAMSLAVTFLSALTLLGNPVEVYVFNTMFWWIVVAMLVAVGGSAFVFTPFFYRLQITTICEYLQMRFNTAVRLLGSFLLIVLTLHYFSFLLYAPSLALSSVTQVSLWGSVVGIGVVVIFYTTLGGMKAVLWTDTFQAVIMVGGLLAVLIRGSIVTGGFAHAWEVAAERGRIKFDDFNVDPSTRHSVWSVVVGGGFFWLALYGLNQAQIQRLMACRTVRRAQLALWINLPVMVIISSLCCMIGVVMFAFYADCHPTKVIARNDQLLPLFVMDILADYQGVPGVFVASVFSGSLSSLSSGLNAVTAVAIKDILLPYCCPKLSDFNTTMLSKMFVIVFGALGIGLAYLVGQMGGTVLQASISAASVMNGPMAGLFLLGMFCPWANSLGAFVGCVTSLAFTGWIVVGAFVNRVTTTTASPMVTAGCGWTNHTTTTPSSLSLISSLSLHNVSIPTVTVGEAATVAAAAAADATKSIPAYSIYTVSYLYYTIIGALAVVVVGLIVSFISGATKPSSLDPRLICPLFDILFPWLPECILRPLRFGVQHEKKYERYEQKMIELKASLDQEMKINVDHSAPSQPQAVVKSLEPPGTTDRRVDSEANGEKLPGTVPTGQDDDVHISIRR